MFKSYLNEILREREREGGYKPEEQKTALKNIKLFQKSRKAVIRLFNDYPSNVSEAKYKTIHGKGNSITSARVAHKVKASDHSNHKIWVSKQLLERFPVAL